MIREGTLCVEKVRVHTRSQHEYSLSHSDAGSLASVDADREWLQKGTLLVGDGSGQSQIFS